MSEQLEENFAAGALVINDANAKLARNLDAGLDRQWEILAKPIFDGMNIKEKRLIADVAYQTLRGAISVDEQRLRPKTDDSQWQKLMSEMYEARKELELEGHVLIDVGPIAPPPKGKVTVTARAEPIDNPAVVEAAPTAGDVKTRLGPRPPYLTGSAAGRELMKRLSNIDYSGVEEP